MGRQALAIVWAQWRSIANYHGSSRRIRVPFTLIFGLIWYGAWAFVAFSIATVCADPGEIELIRKAASPSLLLIFLYWQLVPIIMVTSGISLDLSRLVVYPIPHAQLFGIEVLLRVTTCLEMLLILMGIASGFAVNPLIRPWAPFALLPFALTNLFLSAAIRDLLGRLLVRKGFREAMVFTLVLLAALPQILFTSGLPAGLKNLGSYASGSLSLWGATAQLMLGRSLPVASAAALAWMLATYLFGRWQFERSLRFDQGEARSKENVVAGRFPLLDSILRIPSILFSDPLAALLEKEIRFLSRSARFRLLFLMGFSFGLLIWLPLALRGDPESAFRTNYLTVVSAYALMLLGEVCFWNNFGMDRAAAQTYFVMPLRISTVLIAKNMAAFFFIFLEITIVALFCALLRMPVKLGNIGEAFAVTLVLTVFMLGIGNMLSIRYPRPVDPGQSWRTSNVGRVQAYLLFLYPIVSAPVLLAYGARYAFENELAFFGVLVFDLMAGVALYWVSMESAVQTAQTNREDIIMALSKAEGPVGG